MRVLLFAIGTWLFLGLTLSGQEVPDLPLEINSPGLTIDHQVGFGEFGFNDFANTASFRVHNESYQVLKGVLKVERIHFSRGEVAYRGHLGSTPVELGQGSQQSFALNFGRLREGSLVASFQNDAGRILWQRYVFIQFIESRRARLHVWSVTPDTTRLVAGPMPRGPIANRPQQARVAPLGTRPIYEAKLPVWALPNLPAQLAHGDGLLLGKDSLARLTGAQEAAIANYVAHGGILLLPMDSQAFERALWAHSPFKMPSLESRESRLGLGRILRYPRHH